MVPTNRSTLGRMIKRLIAMAIILLLAGCGATVPKVKEKPCACDWQPLNGSQA